MKQIYGIDLSQKKFDVSFIDSNQKIKNLVVKNNFKGIVSFLDNLPHNVVLCAEHTGVYGELLVFLCNRMNVPIALSSGYEIRHSLGLQKGKTDELDAIRIREYGERFHDKLKLKEYPNEILKELKDLFNLRAQLVKERKMMLTHEKGKQHSPYYSIKVHQIINKSLSIQDELIDDIEKEISKLINVNYELRRTYNLITDIIGIGQITACDLIIKTGNFKVIDSARKAASYSGICPFPNSSGKMVRKSKVSQMADKELKTLLFLCSVVAVNRNPEYKLYYERKKLEGKPYFLIMNNVANKLLRTIYSIVNSGQRYELGHITDDPRQIKNVA